MTDETADLAAALDQIIDDASWIRRRVQDLDAAAHSREGDPAPRGSDTPDPTANQALSRAPGRRTWDDLRRAIAHLGTLMSAQRAAAGNVLMVGRRANSDLRGTLLGDDEGHGAGAELKTLLEAQKRRQDRGDEPKYVNPERQPKIGRR